MLQEKSLCYSAQSGIIYSPDILRVKFLQCNLVFPPANKHLTAYLLLCFFQYCFSKCFSIVFGPLHICPGCWCYSQSRVADFFFHGQYFPLMFLTGEHPSTPFWCFAVPESSSHPPAHSPLCVHRTEKASAGHREGEMRRKKSGRKVILKNPVHKIHIWLCFRPTVQTNNHVVLVCISTIDI